MYSIKNITPRKYQSEIVETAKENNLLCVLPTGVGKTLIGILTAIERLKQHPNSNILFMTPTKPLSAQIQKEFQNNTTIPKEQIVLLTGAITPKKRQELWEQAIVTVATPQTIQKDLENERTSLSPTSLLVIDECHRSRMNFANTKVASFYIQQSNFPRILALTASPGGTKQKIEEIKNNLHIEAIEIRTEHDIQDYIQEKKIHWLEVELPQELKHLNELIKKAYKEKLKDLKKIGFTKPPSIISKKDLLQLQQRFRSQLSKKNPSTFYGISLTALLIKIDYASELLETQGLLPLQEFWNKLQKEETKAAKSILKIPEIQTAISLTQDLIKKDTKHPKLYMLRGAVRKELEKNPNSKIIVFANYRNTINEILNFLKPEPTIKATKLIGQKSGLTQKEQIKTIKDFEEGKYNVIVGTSISEEGLSIGSLDCSIFFDAVPSSIRRIQRSGRVGRIKPGKIIHLITRNTREQGYYWKSIKEEKRMKNILHEMQKDYQTTL